MARRRRSSINRLPAVQREHIERLLREDRLTLDEMINELRERFPGQPAAEISRSGLHRYQQPLMQMTQRMREFEASANAIVKELGENPDDRAGMLLVQSITTLANHAAMQAQGRDDVTIDDVRKFARAGKDIISARGASLKERQAIAQEAREAALRESRARVEALGKTGAIDPAVLATVIKAAYDL